jgi:23S rRNA pseudouridine1911/1915/1917 synthase
VALHDGEYRVAPGQAGLSLDRFLRSVQPGTSWTQVRAAITTGKVTVDGSVCVAPTTPILPGSVVALRQNAPRPSTQSRLSADHLVYVDPHLVVVRKPAGISTVPFEPGERNTLDQLVRALLTRLDRRGRVEPGLGVVHRIDKETTGLLVFARTLAAKRHLAGQFRFHTVERRYLAIVSGTLSARTLESRIVADRGDGRRGSTSHPRLGQAAVTHVRPLERAPDATLVECRLETGRTHQIRIHLAEAGHPLFGERVYAHAGQIPELQAPRVMLHAAVLGFEHPKTGATMRWEEPMPEDMQQFWRSRLGR